MKNIVPNNYPELLANIKERIRSAQYEALRTVNKELITLYWDIGKIIVERLSSASHGDAIVEQLAADLQNEFHGSSGFSRRNIFYMREFYVTYRDLPKVQPLVAQIGWTHNLIILQKCQDPLEREFYIRMTKKFGWSKNVLIHQIENQSYEKTLLNKTNFNETLPEKYRDQAKLAVKDDYSFDFLELADEHSEKELERSILNRLERFLKEMGGLFTFVGSQYRLEVDNTDFFIDLLLYHRRLKCLVAIELKVGKFQPEYVGKMQFYLAALDGLVRLEDENPSIGIILCKEKSRTIVEYSLHDARKPIGVASYHTVKSLPKELQDELPSPEEISRLLQGEDV